MPAKNKKLRRLAQEGLRVQSDCLNPLSLTNVLFPKIKQLEFLRACPRYRLKPGSTRESARNTAFSSVPSRRAILPPSILP
jgi:hypothetical protein